MQEKFCSINYLTLFYILAFVLQYFRTVLSVFYSFVFWKFFLQELFFCSFSLFFRFLCEASRQCFWLSRRWGCFVRMLLILVQTGMLMRSLKWHYVWMTVMFRPSGEPCRFKLLSPLRHTSLFSLLDLFFVRFCVFLWFLCVVLTCTCLVYDFSPPQVWFFFFLFYWYLISFMLIIVIFRD
jgi:hypothetical protein